MSHMSASEHKSTQSDVLPEAPKTNTRKKTQDHLTVTDRPRVGVQDPPSIIHTHRVSIQEPPAIHTRRVSIQEPPIIHTHRVSTQEPPAIHIRRVSIQEIPSINSHSQVSSEDSPSLISSHLASIQDTSSATYSGHFGTQDVSSIFKTRHFNVQNPPLITNIPLINIESVASIGHFSSQDQPPKTWSPHLSVHQHLTTRSPVWSQIGITSAIAQSPENSKKNSETIIWTSERFKNSLDCSQLNECTADSFHSGISVEADSSRRRCRPARLPVGWRLLYQAKKISRQLSLLLSIVGMVIIGLISLGQPWIHFRVPLAPPGDPAGPRNIPIDTIFFVQCRDKSCLYEYDRNAYLLDFAWSFLLFASITSFCLFMMLINIIFFTNSNLPMLEFSNVILSTLTGTNIILGVLFYLMQAQEFLQEGMTYRLGHSFYLAWIAIFFFLMTGLFSYLNYMNFWSILAVQAIWT